MSSLKPSVHAWVGGAKGLALVLSLCAVVAAQPTPLRPAEIAELSWITGHWAGEAFGGRIEENWLEPTSESLSGQFRLVNGGVATMYELLLIEKDGDGEIYYRFKHISPGWQPREAERLEYRLTELDGHKATFRSTAAEPQPGAPWWFTYESPTEDHLVVSIFGAASDEASAVLSMTRR